MFTDPFKNLRALGVKETDVVVDLGAGTGFYAILAAHIATKGKIYAVEISKDFIQIILNKIKEQKLENVECLWGDVEKVGGSKIGDALADKVIASNVFFQVEDKKNFINEIKRILKPGGLVLFVDWSASSPIAHRASVVSSDTAKAVFKEAGFLLEREIDAGLHHYGMIFKKS